MKFKILGFEESLFFNHNMTGIISFSSLDLYFKVVSSLYHKQRIDNVHPDILLTNDKDEKIRLANKVKIIMNPFNLDLTQASLKTKLYRHIEKETKSISTESLMLEFENLINQLRKIWMMFDINLDYDTELDIKKLLRAINLRPSPVDGIELSFLWNYLDYISELKMYEACVFINFNSWLPEDKYDAVHQYVLMKNIPSMFIETKSIHNPYGQSIHIDTELVENIISMF